jgi:hypothetical protein
LTEPNFQVLLINGSVFNIGGIHANNVIPLNILHEITLWERRDFHGCFDFNIQVWFKLQTVKVPTCTPELPNIPVSAIVSKGLGFRA